MKRVNTGLFSGLTSSVALLCGLALLVQGTFAASAAAEKPKMIMLVFTEECFEVFFQDLDFFNVACLKITISKALSYGIIVGSLALKLPQMYNMVSAGSAAGISESALTFEVLTFSVGLVYNFLRGYPLTSYGEQIVVFTENCILVVLFWYYSQVGPSVVKMAAHAVFLVAFMFGLSVLPEHLWWTMPTVSSFIAVAARVPQIIKNYKNKSTGQLSSITWFLQFAGALARLFTTMQETQDMLLAAGFIVGLSCSGTLLVQIALYRGNPMPKED